uniref:Uncharacterized protein n=1 Tax=uncultured prokaryote TaxID=198431 RepID=A0A0H5Q4B5_9ZZZZ|nr:hypothetical protein [uncultured prokaryote]
MSIVIPPGFGQCTVSFRSSTGTQPFVNTFGVSIDTVEEPQTLANLVMGAWAAHFIPEQADAIAMTGVSIAIGQDGGDPVVGESNLAESEGDRSGAIPPLAMAPIIRKQTALGGRTGRGRMFLVGALTETEVDGNGQVDSTRRAALITAAGDFRTALATADLPMVLLHSSGAIDPTPVTSLGLSNLVGWIRGRIY